MDFTVLEMRRNDRIKTKNLEVIKIFADKHLILVKGCVPGHKGAYVIVESRR